MTRARGLTLATALAAAMVNLGPSAAAAQVRSWPSERPPKALPARPFTFPHYEVRALPNGLRVVVVPQHEQPAVSVQLLVRAGSAQDPPGKPGLANLVAALLDQGTTRRTAQQIADDIDTRGGDLSVLCGVDMTYAGATVMTDSFDFALELLSEVAQTPAFAPEELTRQVQKFRSALRVSYEDPDYVASVVFARLVYGAHPYGLPGNGTPESIERLTRDDLVQFHRQYFAPDNSLLAVVGDVTAREAFAAVERVLGGWERRDVPEPVAPPPPKPERRVVVIDKPDAVQTEIRVGHIAIPRGDRDYLPLEMAMRVLGGEGVNRVQQVLRMRRGLTYGASADLKAYLMSGDVVAETDTRTETTAEAVRVIIDEFSRLQREAVSERELDAVKDYMTGNYPLSIETPDEISTKILSALFYDLPLDELQDYRDRVSGVRPELIQNVTRTLLRPDRLTVVLVGNAAAFKDQLRGVGLRNVEIVPLAQLDVTAPDLKKPAVPALAQEARQDAGRPPAGAPPIAEVPEEDAQRPAGASGEVDALLQRVLEAAGGAERLRHVRTVRATALTVMHTPEGPVSTRTTTWIEYPSRLRVDADTASGLVVQAYDDGHAWIQDTHGPRDAPDAMRDAFVLSMSRDWIALCQAVAERRVSARLLPDARGLGGRPLRVVELSGGALPATRLYVDAASAELVRLTYDLPGPRGPETTVESFSDFRQVAGVSIPFKALVQRGGSAMLERTLTGIVIDDPIPDGLFTKPRAAGPSR